MIEMLIVVALIGIVASIALPAYQHATLKARESVLKEDLWVLRDVIDQYFTDKGQYPASLDELVASGYLRKIPPDPMTGSSETWIPSFEPLSEDDVSEGDEGDQQAAPGVTDVRSGATGVALDGTNYGDW